MADPLKVVRYRNADQVAFGPLSEYRTLIGDDCAELAIRTGIQTARPGYRAKPHRHPYVEILHILEGSAQAWEIGREDSRVTLEAGDTLVIAPETWHTFEVVGDKALKLLGTHLAGQRVVHYEDGTVSRGGQPPAAWVEPR